MKATLTHLARDDRAASAAEFALVLPLLLLFLLGMIDVGRLMWTWNQAEKATQTGVRFAVATDPMPNGFAGFSFATSNLVPQGQPISTTVFSNITCISSGCTCTGTACGSMGISLNSTAFTTLVGRMNDIFPQLQAGNIAVDYTNVGLGYSGDPNGPDVAPLVTVRIRNLAFQPLTLILFNSSITLPSFSAALTMEDGQGNVSN